MFKHVWIKEFHIMINPNKRKIISDNIKNITNTYIHQRLIRNVRILKIKNILNILNETL